MKNLTASLLLALLCAPLFSSCTTDDESPTIDPSPSDFLLGAWEVTHITSFYGDDPSGIDNGLFDYNAGKEPLDSHQTGYWIYYNFNPNGTIDRYTHESGDEVVVFPAYTYTFTDGILAIYDDTDGTKYVPDTQVSTNAYVTRYTKVRDFTGNSLVIEDGHLSGYTDPRGEDQLTATIDFYFLTKRQALPAECADVK
jgi:hypothetical protein